MATLTYSQLEQLWIQAGGSPTLAPYAAATAIVESGGDPIAYNASGATGLWQIEYPGSDVLGYSSAQLDNPLDNAKAAVALSKNTMAGLLSNWTAYEPAGAAAAIVKQNGGKIPATTTASTTSNVSEQQALADAKATSAQQQAGLAGTNTDINTIIPGGTTTTPATPSSTGLPSILAGASGLLYDVSTALDYFFGMFGRGQGWRLVFAVICIVALLVALKTLIAAGAIPSGLLPSAIPVPV